MEHVSAPLGRVLEKLRPAPPREPRKYRAEHGLILSPLGSVISPERARTWRDVNLDLARQAVDGDAATAVRVAQIAYHLSIADELSAAIAAAEAYECEPSVKEAAA